MHREGERIPKFSLLDLEMKYKNEKKKSRNQKQKTPMSLSITSVVTCSRTKAI